ncbi:MAG: hypothetical protein IT445_08605 [Phycisphaeraceae bacterium]|nr:hypothetical protein [Phycisphaeraceae bacterium]
MSGSASVVGYRRMSAHRMASDFHFFEGRAKKFLLLILPALTLIFTPSKLPPARTNVALRPFIGRPSGFG